MNSTLKSLLFWTVLFVIGVLIWNVSTKLQRPERHVSFSEFMQWVDSGSVGQCRRQIEHVYWRGEIIADQNTQSAGGYRLGHAGLLDLITTRSHLQPGTN